jgi:hypothetical protein
VASAWRRQFTAGTVVVNPGPTSVSIPLDGTYVTEDGKTVTSIDLQPRTGAVLKGPT